LTDLTTHSERCFPDSASNIEALVDKLAHTANGGLDDECRKLTEDRSTWEPFASSVHTTFHTFHRWRSHLQEFTLCGSERAFCLRECAFCVKERKCC
jgi:hypothetical protein